MDEQLGPYRVLKQLGRGAMGTVFLARHAGLGRDVALKVIRSERASAELLLRFRREMRIASELVHPNLVRVYDCGQADGVDYIAMELLSGQPLDQLIATAAPFDWSLTLRTLAGIARGLAHLHANGILHRDVKPANIICSDEPEAVKLVDFGIARQEDSTLLTARGDTPGTLLYMAPEYLTGAAPGTPLDVWALGCVAYEMLTGRPPFVSTSPVALAEAITAGPLVPPASPGLPQEVSHLVMDLLVRIPARRPAAKEVARRIENLLAKLPVRKPAGPTQVVPRSELMKPRPFGRYFSVGVALAILLAVAAGWGARAHRAAELHELLEKVHTLHENKRYAEAKELCLQARARGIRSKDLDLMLVAGYVRGGQDTHAAGLVEEWLKTEPSDPNLVAQHVEILLRQRQVEAARREVQQALTWASNDQNLLRLAGDVEVYRGNLSAAADCYRKYSDRRPTDLYPRQILLHYLYSAHRDREAWEVYEKAVRLFPDYACLRMEVAFALAGRQKYEQADRIFQEALNCKYPEEFAQVEYRLLRGDSEKAKRDVLQLEKMWPSLGPPTLLKLAELMEKATCLDEAETLFARCIEKDPDNFWLRLNAAKFQMRRKKPHEASASAAQALRLEPNNWEANELFVRASYGAGQREAGRQKAEAMICLPAANPDGLVNLCRELDSMGVGQDSIHLLRLGDKRWHDNENVVCTLIHQLREHGALEEATKLAIDVDKRCPGRLQIANQLGCCFLNAGRFREGSAYVSAALERFPGTASLFLLLAHIRAGSGNIVGAQEAFRQVLLKDPRDGSALAGLAAVQVQQGALLQAQATVERALSQSEPLLYAYQTALIIYKMLRNATRCEEVARKGWQLFRGEIQMGSFLFELAVKRGDYQSAFAVYQEVHIRHKDLRSFAENCEFAFARARREEQAVAVARDLLADEPRDVKVLLRVGSYYMALHSWTEAEATFRRVLAVDPRNSLAIRELSNSVMYQGRLQDAADPFLGAFKDPKADGRAR